MQGSRSCSSDQPISSSRTTSTILEPNFSEVVPDWQLIDEISIKLMEQGIGTFETLQRALPTVVLAQIDEIEKNLQPQSSDTGGPHSSVACSETRLIKLFKLAQFEIDYLLKSQADLLERFSTEKIRFERISKENKGFRKMLLRNASEISKVSAVESKKLPPASELFQCHKCADKIYFHSTFLIDHIRRKHSSRLEAVAGSAFYFPANNSPKNDDEQTKYDNSINTSKPSEDVRSHTEKYGEQNPRLAAQTEANSARYIDSARSISVISGDDDETDTSIWH